VGRFGLWGWLIGQLHSWRDGLPENLQDGDKATQLDEAINGLEELQQSRFIRCGFFLA